MYKIRNIRMLLVVFSLMSSALLFSAPAAAITDMKGNNTPIEKIIGQGKWTVFKVWASNCHVCQETIHYLSDFKKSYPAADVYGISIDGQPGKANAQAFIERFKLKFPNLLTNVAEIDDFLYRQAGETLMGTPTMIVYNPKGKLLAVQPGPVTAKDLISFIQREEKQSSTE